ncbi:MAG: hypothetical protein HY698_21945 [Deltaproteobacteria bacterium]|nr:hypothetical protein [Deltaproteobacteria bacterium]
MRNLGLLVGLVAYQVLGGQARATPLGLPDATIDEDLELDEDPGKAEAIRKASEGDVSFGPVIEIERVVISGVRRTDPLIIRRALGLAVGEVLRAGDPRLGGAWLRIMALGYFSDVALSLSRGTRRGAVTLNVQVVERGSITLDRIFLGTSESSPIWAGIDIGDANVFGSGVGVSVAVVWTMEGDSADLPGADPQLALRFRTGVRNLHGGPISLHAAFLYDDASEPVPLGSGFRIVPYERAGGIAGGSVEIRPRLRLLCEIRVERTAGTDLGGTIMSATAGIEHDTRVDPILPVRGHYAWLSAEPTLFDHGPAGGYVRLMARVGRWIPVRGIRHVVSVHGRAGMILGDAPFFERFYATDWNRLLPPRALDLLVSTRASPDFLGTGVGKVHQGDYAVAADAEYSYRLFRRRGRIHGGDLFAGAGLFGLGPRPEGGHGLPIGLMFDAGLRLDTEIGIFELSFANALGRVRF